MVTGIVRILVLCAILTIMSMEIARHADNLPSMFSTIKENAFKDSDMMLPSPNKKTHVLQGSMRKEKTTALRSANGAKATTNNQEPAHPVRNHGSTTSLLETASK